MIARMATASIQSSRKAEITAATIRITVKRSRNWERKICSGRPATAVFELVGPERCEALCSLAVRESGAGRIELLERGVGVELVPGGVGRARSDSHD